MTAQTYTQNTTDQQRIRMMQAALDHSHWSETTRAAARSEQIALARGNYSPVPQNNTQTPVPWASLLSHMSLPAFTGIIIAFVFWQATQLLYILILGIIVAVAIPTAITITVAINLTGWNIKDALRR